MYDDDDETLESIETWLNAHATAQSSGALTLDMVMGAYIESTGSDDVDPDEIYALMSERYRADRSERGELIFRAVLHI